MDVVHLGPWQLGVADYSLSDQQQRIELEPLLFKLLLYFATHPRRIINRQELVEAIWQQSYVDDNAINRAISELRKVLQHPDLPVSPIKTHHRKGYSLQLDPQHSKQQPRSETSPTVPAPKTDSPQQNASVTKVAKPRPVNTIVLYAVILLLIISAAGGYFFLSEAEQQPGTEPITANEITTQPGPKKQKLKMLNRQKVTWFKGIESRPLLSPDKVYLAYSHTLPNNHVRTIVRKQSGLLASAPQEMIIEDEAQLIFAHTWQPQSQVLLVQKISKDGSACTFERYDFATFPAVAAEIVSRCEHLNISPAQLSQDGHTLFRAQSTNGLLTPSALVAENIATGHIQLLADAPTSGFGLSMLALSPDGKYLAYIMMPESHQPEIYLYSIERREQQRLAALAVPIVIMGLDWSAAGDYLLMPATNALLKLDIASKSITTLILPTELQVGELSLLSDNQAYVSPLSFGSAMQGGMQILRISNPFNPETAKVSPFSEAAGSTHELIFHPTDPKQQAFTANWNGNWQLWLSDGEQHYVVTEFTDGEAMIGSLSWSPNGRYIALTRQGNLYLYDLQLKQLLQKTQNGDIAQTLWLNDNSGLIVTRLQQNNQNLWQLDLLSDNLKQLTFIAGAQPQYDHQGQLHYVRDGQIYRYVDGRRADLPRPELNPGSLYQQNQLWRDQLISFSFMGHLRRQVVDASGNTAVLEAQFPYQFMSLYPNPHNEDEVFVTIFEPPEMALEYIEWQTTVTSKTP
jgi:DNA-binding winged helix-turn-helix (wHTH) protein/Tol biopolymer transport system component